MSKNIKSRYNKSFYVLYNIVKCKRFFLKHTILIITFVILITITKNNYFSKLLYYPEKEYQELELEAKDIIENRNFFLYDNYIINSYKKSNNKKVENLNMTIKKGNILITVCATKLNSKDKEIVIKRLRKNKIIHILFELLDITLIIVIISYPISAVVMCICIIIYELFLFENK